MGQQEGRGGEIRQRDLQSVETRSALNQLCMYNILTTINMYLML